MCLHHARQPAIAWPRTATLPGWPPRHCALATGGATSAPGRSGHRARAASTPFRATPPGWTGPSAPRLQAGRAPPRRVGPLHSLPLLPTPLSPGRPLQTGPIQIPGGREEREMRIEEVRMRRKRERLRVNRKGENDCGT
jgi:hypothetical protein